MELCIGKQIKELRKAKGMTQEQLAQLVGISFQAVSKWENNLALPDITLIPKLAQTFGVSTDELFNYNLKEMEDDIERYVLDAYHVRENNPQKGRKILEEGLQKYPENDILLNNLLYCMNYNENPDETIKLASRLIDKTNLSDVKYDALRFLAYAYHAKGDEESAAAALEQIPELYFTKLSEMAFVLSGKAKYDAAEKQKWISFETLIQMMWKLAECYEADGEVEHAINEAEKALVLIDALASEKKIKNFQTYVTFFEKQIERMKQDKS